MATVDEMCRAETTAFGRFSGPDVWTSEDLESASGRIVLSEECLAEIDQAVTVLRANPLPVLALTPNEVTMPACSGMMTLARRQLDHGVGFCLLDRLPLERMTREEAVAIYWLLAQMIGRPVAQKWADGRMLYAVTDLGKPSGNGVRPDVTNEEQSFHTDNSYNLCPPDHVGLLCLQPAIEGGVSRVVSMTAVYNRMVEVCPEQLDRLCAPYFFDRQCEHADGDERWIRRPVLNREDGSLRVRVSRNLIYQGYRLAGKSVDRASEEALAAWFDIVDDPRMYIEFFFEPGQIQVINNRILGHKRTGFTDWPEADRKRRLMRIWLRDRGRRFYNG